MATRIIRFFIVILLSSLLGYYVGTHKVSFEWKKFQPSLGIINKEPPSRIDPIDFSLFWKAWERLETSYYDKKSLDSQKFLDGAIGGMVGSLGDPFTIYLPPVKNQEFKQGLAGQFEGIGASLGIRGNQIVVVAPLPGSPAQKAGVRAGDGILKVNEESTVGWTPAQAVEKIRGPKGTTVTLTVLHKSESVPVAIPIIRDTIIVESVIGWVKAIQDIEGIDRKKFSDSQKQNKIVYIHLSQFGDNTNQEWPKLVNSLALQAASDKRVKGLVFDLRDNPGGYLADAVFIASEFLEQGVIVSQERGNEERTQFVVNRKGLLTKIPLIVLMNKSSASSSEIVASALRDHKRATIVGETSYGKGTIQEALDLGNGAGLHVTVAKWLSPNGVWLNGKGIAPDIQIQLDSKNASADAQLEYAIQELLE